MGDRAERGLVDEVHVVKDADSGSTEVFSAKLVLFDRARDISLLRLNATAKFEQVVEFLPAKDLKAVDIFTRAYAVGCPLGNRPLPTLGEISSKSKLVADQVFWMLSAPTFFGNSGGGVYLADSCRLIGVSSMIYTYGKANPTVVPHMGLFVPIETIYRWLDGEGYSFIHERKQIPREILWKIAYVEKNTLFPRPAAGPSGE
jgi:S1-C subfamily serine protease